MKKQVAFRIEEAELKELRLKLVEEGKTFQEYMLELIRNDKEERQNAR